MAPTNIVVENRNGHPKERCRTCRQESWRKNSAQRAAGSSEFNNQEPVEVVPDYPYEDRHEYVERRAYELWEKRGRPFGSPEVDWLAAEQAFYSVLLAAGMIAPSRIGQGNVMQEIYN